MLASVHSAQLHLPSVINFCAVSSMSQFVHNELVQRGQSLCSYTCSIFCLRVLEDFKNSFFKLNDCGKTAGICSTNYRLFAAMKKTCTLPVFCGVKGCWKMCNFAHCWNKFFWVSVQQSGPWLHLVVKQAIGAEVTENHRLFSLILPSSVFRMAWSGLNCLQLTMTFQQVGPSEPITEQMPAFYNQAVADGSSKEVLMPQWCGWSPMAGPCPLSSTLHFQCHWRTLSSVLEKRKSQTASFVTASISFNGRIYICDVSLPLNSPLFLPSVCFQSVLWWWSTDWPCCHVIRNGFLIFLVSF